MTANQAQIDYWNGPAGEKWAKYNSETDRNLAAAAEALLKFAAPQPGERVLDIGCGAGATSLLLGEAVGPGGSVTGVDISQPMLALARSRVHVKNIEFIEADAAHYPFQPDYDLIFSRFGVMFFADPVAAFANIRKAAVKKGRLAFACWRPVQENEWVFLPYQAAKPLLPEQEPARPHAPGPFAFADPERVRGILQDSGFADIRIEKFDGLMDLGASPEHASFQMTYLMGPTARALGTADKPTRERVRQVVAEALRSVQKSEETIRLGFACWLVGAKAG
jgi:SAM-dependent methyltransferase